MDKGAKIGEVVKKEIVELNDRFHNKQLLNDAFYQQLMQMEFAYKQCFLISVFPDGSNTYCGQIIRQDGHIFEFDIDLDSAEYSSWKDVTETFRQICDKNKSNKPWLREVMAYSIFSRLGISTKEEE